jgi:PleD family two-component response regulator
MTVEPEYRSLRILIAGGRAPSVRLLRMVLKLAGITDIAVATTAETSLKLLKDQLFDAVFADETIENFGEIPFVVAARREPGIIDPMVPIFLTCSSARLKQVTRARDCGVTDILARPISAATVMRKLSNALLKPRSFIAAPDFFGPDRRGKDRPPHRGEDRRKRKTRKIRVSKPGLDGTEVLI